MGQDIAGAWNIARMGDSVVCTSTDEPDKVLVFSASYAAKFGLARMQMASDNAVDQLDRLLE